jgi:hypothetical protein
MLLVPRLLPALLDASLMLTWREVRGVGQDHGDQGGWLFAPAWSVDVDLDNPAFGAAAGGVAVASDLPLVGTVKPGVDKLDLDRYIFRDRDGNPVITGDPGSVSDDDESPTADILLTNVNVNEGDEVVITSMVAAVPETGGATA